MIAGAGRRGHLDVEDDTQGSWRGVGDSRREEGEWRERERDRRRVIRNKRGKRTRKREVSNSHHGTGAVTVAEIGIK